LALIPVQCSKSLIPSKPLLRGSMAALPLPVLRKCGGQHDERLVEDTIDTLRRYGLTGEIEEGGSGHFKVKFVNGQGSKCLLVVSHSPSNRHAIRKNRAELRRLIRRPAR
jgi:hypothetical protein